MGWVHAGTCGARAPGGRRPGAGTCDAGRPHVPAADPRRPRTTPPAPAALSVPASARGEQPPASIAGAPAATCWAPAAACWTPARTFRGGGGALLLPVCTDELSSEVAAWRASAPSPKALWGGVLLVAGCEVGLCTPSPLPLCRRRPRAARLAWWRPLLCS